MKDLKSAVFKILLVAALIFGVIMYMSYHGGKSPWYVITHFPEELNGLFSSLTQKSDTVSGTQMGSN